MRSPWTYLLVVGLCIALAGMAQQVYLKSDADLIAQTCLMLPYAVLMRLWPWAD